MLRAHTTRALRPTVFAAALPTYVQGIGLALSAVGACMQLIVEKPV